MKLLLAAVCLAALTTPALADSPSKPAANAGDPSVLWTWSGPYQGLPPFDKADPALFPAAFASGIEAQRREVAAIVDQHATPTFANTIAALERAGQRLDRVQRIFSVMTSNVSNPAWQALEKDWSPKFAAADDEITFNARLFQRIAHVHDHPAGLDAVQKRLTDRYYDQFVRAGAKLNAAGKAKLGEINQRLASLFADFSSKLLADENSWTVVASEADLAGMPAGNIAAYKAAAAARKIDGYAVVNTRSAVDPLLTFASNRALREAVWKKFSARGDNGDANDTKAVIAEIVKLRADRAALLGYATHADWRMQDTMAKSPATAMALMMRVWPSAVARVHEEVADMQAIADKEGAKLTIEPWDYLYYAEKVRKAKYDLDQAELKPYFELNNIINASYWAAGKLYGFTFTEVTGKVPTFAPNVRVWEVRDGKRGFVGLFYRDDFARAGKRSGAWMTTYRTPSTFDGPVTVLASNNNNFTPAAPGEPVLISLDDARTLVHEFGHALHYLSMQVRYPGFAQIQRDFVEYPSQFNEHWVLTREVLDKFARHYKTGAPIPQALIDKVKASEKFNQGYTVGTYLSSAIVDMKLHTLPGGVVDPQAFERETLAKLGMPKEITMRHRLPQFGHLFSSDAYSAGYYSYLWSEVMDADTWGAFQESKVSWDPAIAARYKSVVLSTGNQTDRAEAFRAFRGRDPDVKAYLEKRGFPAQ